MMEACMLPVDILHLLCEELALQEQFDTLFNCACASRALAIPALTNLYRHTEIDHSFHHQAPVRGGGDDVYGLPLAMKLLSIQRWSILWRSIIASSLKQTLFPYCRYIRSLDFRDLENLLEDDQFRLKVGKQFFSGPLKQFEKSETVTNIKGRKFTRLKNAEIIDAIGEVVTHDTPTLEIVAGDLSSDALVRWMPRLPRLRAIELKDGKALKDELLHASIRQHCPLFDTLMIFSWTSPDSDDRFSTFLSSMRPNSLRKVEIIRDINIGAETFLSLNNHGKSLQDLRLCVSNDSLPHLSLLQGCTALRILRIEDVNSMIDLEAIQNDTFLDTISWLRACKNLKHINLTKMVSGAAIITPILLEPDINLSSVEVDSYVLKDHKAFHKGLVHQQATLRSLSLSGDTDGMFRDDLDNLVDSLRVLTHLKDLNLMLPEVLRDEHFIAIISNLTQLVDLHVSGLELNDIILDSLSSLTNLRNLTLSGISKFTSDALLDFISQLGPANQGIRVTIDMADPDTLLDEGTVTMLREVLAEKTRGTLEYMALRDPNISEFEGESD